MLLRKSSVQFKDYAGKPIGFGIVVFCLAQGAHCLELYRRFHDAFAPHGE